MYKYIQIFAYLLFVSAIVSCNGKDRQETKSAEQEKKVVQNQKPAPVMKIQKVEVLSKFEHDPNSFTQGLQYFNGFLYESTGLKGESSLRKIDPATGRVLRQTNLEGEYFAEGLTIFKKRIYQITWTNNVCFVYDIDNFKQLKTFRYSGEGWGLTNDGKSIIMSDGTNMLKFINPETFELEKSIAVVDAEMNPVHYLNELEMLNGEIWANIWQSDKIVRIDPKTGTVFGWIDLSPLRSFVKMTDRIDVLNGIAYDTTHDKIYVTGKYWSWIFEVKILD